MALPFEFTQANRAMKVTTELGWDYFLVLRVQGREKIMQPYELTLHLITPKTNEPEFDKVVGQPMSVELQHYNGGQRYFGGIVRELYEMSEDRHFRHYQVKLMPRLSLGNIAKKRRIFQDKNVGEIIQTIIGEYGVQIINNLQKDYPAIRYCTQYDETDLAFITRLMEEWGIHSYYHPGDRKDDGTLNDPPPPDDNAKPQIALDKIVLDDKSLDNGGVLGNPGGAALFDDSKPAAISQPRVTKWRTRQKVTNNKLLCNEHVFQLTDRDVSSEQSIDEKIKVGQVEHTLQTSPVPQTAYNYMAGYGKVYDDVAASGGDQTSQLNNVFTEKETFGKMAASRETVTVVQASGLSECVHWSPGYQFELGRHPSRNGNYLLLDLEFEAMMTAPYISSNDIIDRSEMQTDAMLGDKAAFRDAEEQDKLYYLNSFKAAPASVVYYPEQTIPRPRVHGLETGKVAGGADADMVVDKYGRCKVVFHWDRDNTTQADKSCWIRVSQIWAGPKWGAFFWPRIGHEALVDFIDGDPDRPVVVGFVYNSVNMPPQDLPDCQLSCGIRSCTYQGDPSIKHNDVVLHDVPGIEHCEIHSERYSANVHESHQADYSRCSQMQVTGSEMINPSKDGTGSGG